MYRGSDLFSGSQYWFLNFFVAIVIDKLIAKTAPN